MALQVWLPLTQDTRNQGLCGGNITTSGIAFTDGGKLGAKYLSAGTITIPASTCKKFFNKNHMSFAFWLYPIGTSSSAIIMGQNAMSAGNNRMYSIFQYSTPNDLHLSWQDETSSTTFLGSVDTGFFAADTWTHCCITYNGSVATVYRNGILYSTHNGTSNRAAFEYDYPITGSTLRKLQDVRIYDHCLSPMEVKELAKGLILHYPLNRQGYGQENNIAVSKIANRGCTNFTYNSLTQEWSMTCPTASSTWGYGIVINDRNIRWATSQTWVVSMEVYVPRSIMWQCDINNKPDLEDISEYTGNDYDITGQRQVCTNGTKGSKTLQAGWNKIWFSQTANTTYGLTNYSTNWGIITTNESSTIDIKLRNIKGEIVEAGLPIQPTTWCPNSVDVPNLATEYDCSGFGNNGTRIGTFTWINDAPKYNVSTKFGSTSTKIQLPIMNFSGMANSYTFAWWQYNVSTGNMPWGFSNGNRLNCYHCSPLCWNTGDGSTNQFKDGSTTISPSTIQNAWHHMVITGDGVSTKLYIDGIYKGTAITYKPLTGTQIWISGWDSGTSYTFNGSKECDFRIYATTLSASDVLSLYQNNAYIDSNNTIHGKIRT